MNLFSHRSQNSRSRTGIVGPALWVLALLMAAILGALLVPAYGTAGVHRTAGMAPAATPAAAAAAAGAAPKAVDHDAVNWDQLPAEPDPSAMAVAAYGA